MWKEGRKRTGRGALTVCTMETAYIISLTQSLKYNHG